ncbi:MAG: hypothetical protein JXA11_06450 [Phycisphaerae bacterium]|nr:hypothetical protein [Phycisphaerae bacterium]
MDAFVVDTNVAVVANGKATQADVECQLTCTKILLTLRETRVSLDSGDRILAEYRNNLSMSGQPGVGDMFMRWIHQNQYNPKVCERVRISPHTKREFEEFPNDPRLNNFDLSDRKFVAVALASKYRPYILNAVDPDWSEFKEPLSDHKVKVKELCPQCIRGLCSEE